MYLTMFNLRSDKINKKLEEKKQNKLWPLVKIWKELRFGTKNEMSS